MKDDKIHSIEKDKNETIDVSEEELLQQKSQLAPDDPTIATINGQLGEYI